MDRAGLITFVRERGLAVIASQGPQGTGLGVIWNEIRR